jgi:hypothetical protein
MRIVRLLIIGLSLLVGAAAVGVLFAIAGTPRTPFGWAWGVLAFGLGFLIARTTLSLGVNTSAAFGKGKAEAASESRGAAYEATGRRAGAVVGKGLNKVARIGAPKPAVEPKPAQGDTSATKPDVTVDKAARVIGSMVGRRVAQRRNKR